MWVRVPASVHASVRVCEHVSVHMGVCACECVGGVSMWVCERVNVHVGVRECACVRASAPVGV